MDVLFEMYLSDYAVIQSFYLQKKSGEILKYSTSASISHLSAKRMDTIHTYFDINVLK